MLEHNDFLLSQVAESAAGEVFFCQATVVDAVQAEDAVAEVLEDAAYDAVSANVELDSDLIGFFTLDVRDRINQGGAVFQGEAIFYGSKVGFRNRVIQNDVVHFFHLMPRMCKPLGECAVIGEHQQAGGVPVETAYWEDPLTDFLADISIRSCGPEGRWPCRWYFWVCSGEGKPEVLFAPLFCHEG